MSKVYEDRTIVKREVASVVCDRCGDVLPKLEDNDTRDFNLKFSTGYLLGWGEHCGDGWVVDDLCDGCADVLKALLDSNGFKVREFNY